MERLHFCPQCGTKLEPDERFCGQCGYDTETPVSTDPHENPAVDPFSPVVLASPPQAKPAGTQKTAIIILAAVLGALFLIGGGTLIWFNLSGGLVSKPNGLNTATSVIIEPPSYSLNEGSYTATQQVEINKPTGEDIVVYFTLDGSDPSTSTSVYSSPIVLNATTTVKSIAVDKKGNHSGIKTATYIITLPQQAATTQPATTTPAATTDPASSEWQQFENNINGTWKWTDSSGFTLYYQFSGGMLLITDGGSDYYYDSYRSTVSTGSNGTVGTVYSGDHQLNIDCNPMGDNGIYIDGYYCSYVP